MPNPVANGECRSGRDSVSGSAAVTFSGRVSDGLGRGADFVSLPGYARQFEDRLGYDPYPGTLNVAVEDGTRDRLAALDAVRIDGWEDGDRSFGAVHCYPATIRPVETEAVYVQAHVVVPIKTDHDDGTLELLAPDRVRDALGLSAGSPVHIVAGEGEE